MGMINLWGRQLLLICSMNDVKVDTQELEIQEIRNQGIPLKHNTVKSNKNM
jgi:hypothetical protein